MWRAGTLQKGFNEGHTAHPVLDGGEVELLAQRPLPVEAAVTTSLHEVDLLAALRFLTSGHRPEITVLGVEPETIETGLELSPSVQATLPRLVTAAQEIVRRWHT